MITIARDNFQMTMELADAVTGAMEPLQGIKIDAYVKGTTTHVSIFQRRTGATEGPAPETGGTNVGPGTFVTGPTGAVEFWCDGPAELDIAIADTQGPARIPARTLQWNFVPAANGSLPTSMLAVDGGLTLASFAADVKRQLCQIGQVIDWWRPAASVPIPSGFEICDGHQVLAGQHDFAGLGGSNINVPDLRNCFILGALPTNSPTEGSAGNVKAHGTAATMADAATDGPGIAGNGGSQRHSLAATETPLRTHTHTQQGTFTSTGGGAHSHSMNGAGAHNHYTISGTWVYATSASNGGQFGIASGSYTTICRGDGYVTSSVGDHTHGINGVGDHTHNTTISGVTTGASVAEAPGANHNNTPKYFGLLKLMKVRYS